MDGLDGLVAGCMAVSIAALRSISLRLGLWALLGSLLGFLIWNWSPAKLFMGDVGSPFLERFSLAWSYRLPAGQRLLDTS